MYKFMKFLQILGVATKYSYNGTYSVSCLFKEIPMVSNGCSMDWDVKRLGTTNPILEGEMHCSSTLRQMAPPSRLTGWFII